MIYYIVEIEKGKYLITYNSYNGYLATTLKQEEATHYTHKKAKDVISLLKASTNFHWYRLKLLKI